MQNPTGARPRTRSPFAAAFLSLLFPGLGHLYAGAPMRALAFAAAPILALALGGGVFLRMDRLELVGLALSPAFLSGVFWVNILVLVYRIVAVIDAYRVAQFMNAHSGIGDGRLGPARIPGSPLAIAGLIAVILVMAGSHVVVARYDLIAQDALTSGCIFISDTTKQCDATASDSPDPSDEESESAGPTETPSAVPSVVGTPVPEVPIPAWNGKDRLNILLIGADTQGGGHRTDTMITVSIDPVTKQVAMFSLPRDTKNVPMPPEARRVWGSVFGQKINAFFAQNRGRSDIWPGTDNTRGYNALKTTLGYLYGLDIKYFVEVDFNGFKKVIDALGGVNVNVQVPVVDDTFPSGVNKDIRLYIPSGLQHMDGAQALRYARSRNTSSDFDRAARQQRLLISLREQADPQALIPRLPDLVAALKKSVRTDIPLDQLDELLGLATGVDTKNIRSYVFSPPLYQTEVLSGYWTLPKVDAIRATIKNAFKVDQEKLEAQRQTLAGEGAQLWVLNPTSDVNRGTRLAGYLESQGLEASAPRQRPEGGVPATTQVVVYNGAESKLPETIKYLEKKFGVTAQLKTDPAMRADVVVTIGRNTADLRPPASS
jgi:LCP family protein required for cell wall assembly